METFLIFFVLLGHLTVKINTNTVRSMANYGVLSRFHQVLARIKDHKNLKVIPVGENGRCSLVVVVNVKCDVYDFDSFQLVASKMVEEGNGLRRKMH